MFYSFAMFTYIGVKNNTSMKVLNPLPVSSFGGLNFVIKEAIDLKINGLLNTTLPDLPPLVRDCIASRYFFI